MEAVQILCAALQDRMGRLAYTNKVRVRSCMWTNCWLSVAAYSLLLIVQRVVGRGSMYATEGFASIDC